MLNIRQLAFFILKNRSLLGHNNYFKTHFRKKQLRPPLLLYLPIYNEFLYSRFWNIHCTSWNTNCTSWNIHCTSWNINPTSLYFFLAQGNFPLFGNLSKAHGEISRDLSTSLEVTDYARNNKGSRWLSLSKPLPHLLRNPKDPLVAIVRQFLRIWQVNMNIWC